MWLSRNDTLPKATFRNIVFSEMKGSFILFFKIFFFFFKKQNLKLILNYFFIIN